MYGTAQPAETRVATIAKESGKQTKNMNVIDFQSVRQAPSYNVISRDAQRIISTPAHFAHGEKPAHTHTHTRI